MGRWWPFRKARLGWLDGSTMGTSYTVKFVAGLGQRSEAGLQSLRQAIDDCLAGVVRRMSPWLADSEISRFNAHHESSPFPLSNETFHVLQRAMQISEESRGAFDATVGPLVNLYGFGRGPFRVALPTDEELQPVRERVGYRMLELDSAAGTVRKKRTDIQCDLSGIAKGFAVDRVAALLDKHEITDYVVEIGGEVRARGHNPDGRAWQIAIEQPIPEARAVHRVVGLTNQSVATSGDYRVCYMRDGRRISHTIDPRTGRPVLHDVASVTVVCPECELADGWATALTVLGPEEGCRLSEEKQLAALFLVRLGDNQFVERLTPAFREVL